MEQQINQGYFIARKLEDGTPGRPVGNDDGAISMFDDLDVAKNVRDEMQKELGALSIFRMNLVYVGEVIL